LAVKSPDQSQTHTLDHSKQRVLGIFKHTGQNETKKELTNMAVDEFGREIPADRSGRRGDRSPSPHLPSPTRGNGGTAPLDGAPSHLYEALPTSRHGRSSEDRGGAERSSRKRSHRSESPPSHPRHGSKSHGGSGGGGRKYSSSKHQPAKPHPSKVYAEEPMLCQFLWKEANPDKASNSSNKDDEDGTDEEYDEYRRGYCLNYVRKFFNEHMDDSWFRAKYSPLEAHRAALQERERATREATQFVAELEESIAKNKKPAKGASSSKEDKCSFVVKARLGGGIKQPRKLPGDDYHSTSPSKYQQQQRSPTNHVPTSHVLSLSNQVLPIHDVPPHVTDEQLTVALMSHCTSPAAVAASRNNLMQVYSSSPAFAGDLHRTAFFFAPEEIRKDIITTLNNLDRGAATPAIAKLTTTEGGEASTSHVPRKEDTFIPKELELIVECSDPYGRMEVDADGKGGAPEDGGVTPRKARVILSTAPLTSTVQVLSAAVSSRDRIRQDARSALTLATALDRKRNIPEEKRLVQILSKASLPVSTNSNGKYEDESSLPAFQDIEDALDVSVAYLRRVHLFSFYNGCATSPNVGDVFSQNHATSTIHLRLAGADDLSLQKGDSVAADAAAPSGPVDLLVQRLDNAIDKAHKEYEAWTSTNPASSVVVSSEMDKQAEELLHAESQVEDVWINDHAFLDEDGRARCSFHFCRKLFKDYNFLKKHLLKKHPEFLRADMAKCHDSYMMEAWDREEQRPVPPILVDCGRAFSLVDSPVLGGATPLAADPEPELWRRQEERRKLEEEEEERRRERFSNVNNNNSDRHHNNSHRENELYHRNLNDPSGGLDSALSEPRSSRNEELQSGGPPPPSRRGFVDVDDMKVEKVEMAFDNVEVPVLPPKKKKRKKLL
jgi:hypothetical protein